MTDEKPVGFEIDGTHHEMPLVGSFDMDENRIFNQQTGLHAEDVWLGLQSGGGMTFGELMRNEGFLTALAHIAYRRENPDIPDDVIAKKIGKVNRVGLFASLVESLVEAEEEDPKEQVSTTAPSEPSTSSSVDRPNTTGRKAKSSGKRSKKSSVPPEETPANIGTTGSDTSATSVPLRRVV